MRKASATVTTTARTPHTRIAKRQIPSSPAIPLYDCDALRKRSAVVVVLSIAKQIVERAQQSGYRRKRPNRPFLVKIAPSGKNPSAISGRSRATTMVASEKRLVEEISQGEMRGLSATGFPTSRDFDRNTPVPSSYADSMSASPSTSRLLRLKH